MDITDIIDYFKDPSNYPIILKSSKGSPKTTKSFYVFTRISKLSGEQRKRVEEKFFKLVEKGRKQNAKRISRTVM